MFYIYNLDENFIPSAKELSESIFADHVHEIALELSYDPSVSEDISWCPKL